MDIKRLFVKHKIVVIIFAALLILVGVYFSSQDDGVVALDLPAGTVQVVNALNETITLEVKIADTNEARSNGFSNIAKKDASQNIIYGIYPFNATIGHSMEDVLVNLEMLFFASDGQLIEKIQAKVGSDTSYSPEAPYRYTIIAAVGLLGSHNITEEAVLLPETLERK